MSKVFITEEGREALEKITNSRRKNIDKTSDDIYKLLKEELRHLNFNSARGEDRIIYAVERMTGKTTAIIRIAEEFGIPIVADKNMKRFLDNLIKQRCNHGVKIINLKDLEQRMDGTRFMPYVVLVDQGTDVSAVRRALDLIGFMERPNIIGIK